MTLRIRKALGLAAAACLLLAGCSSEESDTHLLVDALRNAVTGPGPSAVTLGQAAAIPYASLGVRIGDGSQFLIVLAMDAPHSRLWTAGKAIALQTDDGRIVRTSGLAHNLSGVSGQSGVPISPRDALKQRGGTRTLLYDFADLNAYSVKTVCRTTNLGRETITVLGKAIPTLHVEESCHADALGWSFVNTYWMGAKSGMVWKSIQYVHPQLGPISTEILRPPKSE
jgi:hypothetical protein